MLVREFGYKQADCSNIFCFVFVLTNFSLFVVVIRLDGNNLDTMSSTPQKGFSAAAWNKLQRDLNSPSASCRIRAIRAIKYESIIIFSPGFFFGPF